MKNTFIITLLALCFLSACSKYEEGPALSLRSKTARLCGSWKMSEVLVNGTPQENSTSAKWEISKNGSCSRTSTDSWTQTETTIFGKWSFKDDEALVEFIWEIPSLNMTLTESWTILKLKEKELWLETISYGSISECRFVQ